MQLRTRSQPTPSSAEEETTPTETEITEKHLPKKQKTQTTQSEKSETKPTTSAASPTKTKKLTVGSALPKSGLLVTNTKGEVAELSSLFQNGGVLFFYPKANTPGCTTQALGFSHNHTLLTTSSPTSKPKANSKTTDTDGGSSNEEGGFVVFGMSRDHIKSQLKWKTKHSLPYDLLSDLSPGSEVLKFLGVLKSGGGVLRSHIIFGKGGVVRDLRLGVSPKESVEGVCAFVTEKK